MIILIFGLIAVASSGCPPAVKGKSYSFHGFVKIVLQKVELVWLRGKTPRSLCRSNLNCYSSDDSKTITSIKFLGDEKYEFNLTLTNVTDKDESVWYLKFLGLSSLRTSSYLYMCNLSLFDMSVLKLQDCPLIVEEGSTARCQCNVLDEKNNVMTFGWYDSNNLLLNNGDQLLSYNASRDVDGFECRGSSSTGLRSLPATYNPLVVAKSNDFDCAIHYNQSGQYVLCKIERIYPEAVCDFVIYGNTIKLVPQSDEISYKSQPWSVNSLYYYTECNVKLPDRLIPGNISLDVTVFPNITGSESDKTFGLKKKFDLELSIRKMDQLVNYSALIALVCIVMIVALSVGFTSNKGYTCNWRQINKLNNIKTRKEKRSKKQRLHKQCLNENNESVTASCVKSKKRRNNDTDQTENSDYCNALPNKYRITSGEREVKLRVINESEESEGYCFI